MLEVEARPYGPDCTPEELEAIRARVSLHRDGMILYREIPMATPFTIGVCYDRVEALIDEHGCTGLIVDVREAVRPDAAARKRINECVNRLAGRLRHISIFMGNNPLLLVAARFIQTKLAVPLTFHGSLEAAEEALRDAAK